MAGAWVIILRALCGPWAPFYGLRGGFGIPECQKPDHRVNPSRCMISAHFLQVT